MFPFFADRDMGHEQFGEVQHAIQTTVHKHLTGSQYLHFELYNLIYNAFNILYTLEGVKSQFPVCTYA